MFEIGNSLREARLRQGLELARAETDTKIRAKYLQALEEERFHLLPAETYVKGFLRTYAEYLGLDGQLYVDEFNSRFALAEEPLVAPRRTGRPRGRATESNFVVVALAGIVAVTVLIVIALGGFGSGNNPTDAGGGLAGAPPTTTARTGGAAATTATKKKTTRPHKPRLARLALTAARGDCWMKIFAGSATGDVLYEGTLEQGQTQQFTKRKFWIQLGAPSALDVRLNGKAVRNFPRVQAIVVVTARGVRTVSKL